MTGPSPHVSEDQLINLLNDLASEEEDRSIRQHLEGCPECEERFRLLVREREELASEPAPRMVNGRIERPEQGGASPRRASGPRAVPARGRWLVWGMAAAIVVVLVLLLPRLRTPESDSLVYWLPVDEMQATFRSEGTGTPQDFMAGIDAYRRRDAHTALAYFERSQVPDAYVTLRDIYLASALILNDRFADAEAILVEIDIPTLPSPWRRRSWWLLYIALRKGDDRRADRVLEELIDAGGEIGARARAERERRENS